MSDNQAIVRDFIDACNANDVERVMTFFTDDCVYHNVPIDPVTGPDAIRGVLTGFMGMASEIDWVVHNIAESSGGVVLTERTDRFLIGEKWLELPVMGTFDLRDGKICGWRDYFDMQQFQRQLPG
jgi:limonene-1,2-epoxide hydrolase